MGHILNRIISRARLRNLDRTRLLGPAEKSMSIEVADLGAVNI